MTHKVTLTGKVVEIDFAEPTVMEMLAMTKVDPTPLMERLGGDFLEIMTDCQNAYTEYFRDSEEIGSSDVNCFLMSHLRDMDIDHETVSDEDWQKMKRWGCN
tara:strand:- start:6108 stop:6413 length:306 start_codon:yes stop_codon:yes gene_type:complete